MLDLHCHILPGVDDGAKDMEAALAMGRALVEVGYTDIAASPHFGHGPGGHVSRILAAEKRNELSDRFAAEGIALKLHPNAEHHVGPSLFEAASAEPTELTPIGGDGQWLLVELPWQPLSDPETVIFRLQSKGYRLLLAHPERYQYIEMDMVERLVERGVRMQLEIGSFVNVYGKRAHFRALGMVDKGLVHVLCTDLHRPEDAATWVKHGLRAIGDRYGKRAVAAGTERNPRAILDNASIEDITPMTLAR